MVFMLVRLLDNELGSLRRAGYYRYQNTRIIPVTLKFKSAKFKF